MSHRERCATRVIISPWHDKTASHNSEDAPTRRRQEVKHGKFHAEPSSSRQPLFWKSSGAILMPSSSVVQDQAMAPDTVLKQDALLCKRVVDTHGEQPTQYNAREERNQKEEWRQLQVELSLSTLSIYATPALTWPSRELEDLVIFDHTPHLRLYLASPLDYTFCLRYRFRTEEYVTLTFRARSMTLSQEWYVALYRVLPDHCKPVCSPWCEVHIPLMDLSVRIPLVDADTGELRYDITVRHVKDAVLALLEKDQAWATNIQSRLGKENLGMCWTRGSRTEWVYWTHSLSDETAPTDLVISPQHIEQTHRLELRRIEHTPNTIEFSDETLVEPPPVEGFLYRVTTFTGKPIPPGSLARRRFYFASFDQYLFIIHTTHTLKPPKDQCYQEGLQSDTFAAVSPFTTPDATETEIKRRLRLMTDASRVIDLTEVSHVSRSFNDEEEEDHSAFDVDNADSLTATILHRPLSSPEQRQRNPRLEIVMQNGIVLKLKSDSSGACDAWVRHLSRLIVYWRAHKEASLNINAQHDFSDMFDEEFRLSLTDEEKGSDFNRKPVVDTRIWSICAFDQCREVVKTGVMYFQPRSRGTFSQKIFVLTADGWLMYYNIYERAPISCQPIVGAIHDRKDAVNISSCYVYSSASPRRPTRIFPDGIAAADVNDDSLFCLWKPLTRRVFSPRRQRLCVYKNSSKFFQQDGETWQFLAKNRHEKEEWVWAINVVIEQLLRGK
ncbi:hypothetical protein BJV82DRAFT_612191 [Fennellomyces sp. T-0311]|nr:hypothetical protein BJV82DRAFT_612191 [Fennellomyces sp. T-0311]